MRHRPLLTAIALIAAATAAHADIFYTVRPAADGSRLSVEVRVPVTDPHVSVQIPSWSPGAYASADYGKAFSEFSARADSGAAISVAHPRPDTWEAVAPAGTKHVTFSYAIVLGAPGVRGMMGAGFDGKVLHWGGPGAYVYVVGRKDERCRLTVAAPPGWKVGIGLKASGGASSYVAKNYDVLADNPVTAGDFVPLTFTVRGKEHQLNFRGPGRDAIDREKTRAMCAFVVRAASDFFGGVPYDKYVFHFFVTPGENGAGGLEHASSAQMFARTGLGPGTIFGTCHEYFHLWNVKRIRSSALGPFDYTQLPRTGALWWLEGVTDYYAHRIPYLYGGVSRDEFLKSVGGQIGQVRQNPARLEVSPYDSSYRVADAVGSFSSGYRVSYYPTGFLLGLLFDIEIRARTDNRRSLDDVERTLWNLCRDDRPGFPEDEIRAQLVRAGGAEMGTLYDTWVMRPGELPVEDVLAKAGLELVPGARPTVREKADASAAQKRVRDSLLAARAPVDPFDPATVR